MKTSTPNLTENLQIVQANLAAYKSLQHYHYRTSRLGPFRKIFAITQKNKQTPTQQHQYLGVIVYSLPPINCQLRNVATNNRYMKIKNTSQRLKKINRDLTIISRVIIDPRIAGVGIATWLIKNTLHLAGTPNVEALAIMGHINPFFQRAGMKPYSAPLPKRCITAQQAFTAVGITEKMTLDPHAVFNHIQKLPKNQKQFINTHITKFLQAYGNARKIQDLLEKIKYTLPKLNHRPVYYYWQKPANVSKPTLYPPSNLKHLTKAQRRKVRNKNNQITPLTSVSPRDFPGG